MHSADILVIPSLWEGFGLIAAEGMACGIPIVASNVPGLSEVIGDAGLKVDATKPELIKKAIESIESARDKGQLYNKEIERASMFDISNTVNKYLMTYRHLIKE